MTALLRPAAVLGLLAILVGCGGEPQRAETPSRIVAIAPSASEILFDLGLGERVVGVGDYAIWPPEVEGLPRLGGLYDVRLETIVALEPDLAVLIASERELGEQLERLGIEVLIVDSDSLEQVERAIVAVAERCGVAEAGREAVARFRAGLERRRPATRLSVLVTMGREAGRLGSVMAAGGGSFVSELVELAGGTNVFADAALPYPQVGAEQLIGRGPQVVIELQYEPRSAEQNERLLADWRQLPDLPAVERDCLQVIDGSFTVLPGPRLPLLYREIVGALESCEAGDG